jgi:adenylate kinase family enzyme
MIYIYDYSHIIIIGSAGSGKSWLAKRVAALTGYPLSHLDVEFWQPGWVKTPKEDWISRQQQLISRDKWIIDGHYQSTLELRFQAADLVIFLDINRWICILGALSRHGKKRSDLPDYLNERLDGEFVEFCKWIWNFPGNGRKKTLSLHQKYPEKEFLVFSSRRQMKAMLRTWQNSRQHEQGITPSQR